MAGSTDWGGLLLAGGVIVGGYLLYTSGAIQQVIASLQNPGGGQFGGYCQDGSQPNPATRLCMNGMPPSMTPPSPYGPGMPGQPGQPCYGQDMYTGQPCMCPSPYMTSSLLGQGYGGYPGQSPTSPTCNCQNCGQQGYGQPSPYGSPYGQPSPYGSPYGQYPGQMPYGQPGYPGTSPYGLPQIGPYGGSPYSTPPYGIPGSSLVSPYGIGPYGGLSPFAANPIIGPSVVGIGISPTLPFGGGFGSFGLPGFGGPGGGGGGGFGGAPGAPGGGFRHAFQGTTDLNGYAGRAIAADAGFGG